EVEIVVAISTVDEQTRRNVLKIGTDLEVFGLGIVDAAEERVRFATTGDLVVSRCGSELEAAELTRITESHVPHVVFAPRGAGREATERLRVLADGVLRQAVT